MKVYLLRSNACLADNLLLANTALKRLRGLLGRKTLPAGQALWIRPCNSVHSWWMLFAIDVIFVDKQLRIVKIIENLRPFRLTLPCRSATSVFEFPLHTIAHHKITIGDTLTIEK